MKTLRISATIVTLFISVLFVGCSDFSGKKVSGAKIPEYHGSYVLVDGAWVGLNADTVIDSEQPEILIYDPMIKTGMVTGDDLATLKRYLIIDQEVEEIHQTRDGPIVGYTSKRTNDMTTSFSGSDVDLRTRPVEGMDEIIVLTPAKPVQSGKYRLKTMHDSHIIDIENDLEADSRYIKWYLTLNDAENFSWDGWAARTYDRASSESAYNGRAILSVNYRPLRAFEALKLELKTELESVQKENNLNELIAFRKKVLGLDKDLFDQATQSCKSAIGDMMSDAYSKSHHSSILALIEIAKENGIEITEDATGIEEEIQRLQKLIQVTQSLRQSRIKRMTGSMKSSSDVKKRFSFISSNGYRKDLQLVITENHITFEERKGGRTNSIWLGNIKQMDFPSPQEQESNRKKGFRVVNIRTHFMYNRGGWTNKGFGFKTEYELFTFIKAVLEARHEWEEKWSESRKIEIVAPPRFWSESLETPYDYEVVSAESIDDDFEILTGRKKIYKVDKTDDKPWRGISRQAKFRSLTDKSITLKVTLLPFTEPDLARFSGITNIEPISSSATAYDPTSSFNADSASSRSNTPSLGTGSQNSSTSPQTNNQTTTATLPRDVEKILSIVNTPSKPVTVGLTDKIDGSYEFTRSTKLDSGGIEKTKNVITIQGKLFHYDIYTVISDKLANGTPSYVASHKKYGGLVKRKTNDSVTITLVKEERLVGYPRERMPTGVIRTRWPWGQGSWTFGFTGDYAYDKRNQNTKFKKVK